MTIEPTEEEKARAKEIKIRNLIRRYWGAVAVVQVCQLAAQFNNEMINGVDLGQLPDALELAFDVLNDVGIEVMPALHQLAPGEGVRAWKDLGGGE